MKPNMLKRALEKLNPKPSKRTNLTDGIMMETIQALCDELPSPLGWSWLDTLYHRRGRAHPKGLLYYERKTISQSLGIPIYKG